MWSTIGVIFSFVAIVVLVTRRVQLGYALFIGSAIAALTSGLNPLEFVQVIGNTLVKPGTISLVADLVLISILGSLMKKLGVLDKMVDALQKVLRNTKLTIAVIPSIMSTLVVTGGAIMAAPMVNTLGERLNLSNDRRAAVNLLFRHAWFFIFPFTPAFILVKEIAGISINQLILVQLPLTVVAVVADYLTCLHNVKDDSGAMPPATKQDYLDLLRYTSPLWVSLVLALGFGIRFELALVPGLGLALYYGKPELKQIPELLWKGIQMPIVLSGIGIMVFKDVLTQGNTLSSLTDSMMALGLPLEVIIILLPALVGLISASSTSAIGITLPLLLPAMQQSGHLVLFTAGVYVASYLGYFVSPLHLCQVLTVEFFHVKLPELYRIYLVPVSAMWLTLFATIIVGRLF